MNDIIMGFVVKFYCVTQYILKLFFSWDSLMECTNVGILAESRVELVRACTKTTRTCDYK